MAVIDSFHPEITIKDFLGIKGLVIPKEVSSSSTRAEILGVLRGPNAILSDETKIKNREKTNAYLKERGVDFASEDNVSIRAAFAKELGRIEKDIATMEAYMDNNKLREIFVKKGIDKKYKEGTPIGGDYYLSYGGALSANNKHKEALHVLLPLVGDTTLEGSKRTSLLVTIADCYYELKEVRKAREYYNLAILGTKSKEVLGYSYVRLMNFAIDEDMEVLDRYLKKIEEIDSPSRLADAYFTMASALTARATTGRFTDKTPQECEDGYKGAIHYLEKITDMEGATTRQKASAYYELYRVMVRRGGREGKIFGQAEVEMFGGRSSETGYVSYLKKALEIAGGEDVFHGRAQAALCGVLVKQNRYEQAIVSARSFLADSSINFSQHNRDMLVGYLGVAQYRLKNYKGCLETFSSLKGHLPELLFKNYVEGAQNILKEQEGDANEIGVVHG